MARSSELSGWREMQVFLDAGSGGVPQSQEVRTAGLLAVTAHAGQKRRYSEEPYIVHPIAVANMVHIASRGSRTCHEVVVAALLHDTIEDTAVTVELLEQIGVHENAVWLTVAMTDVETPSDGNRAARHELKCKRMREHVLHHRLGMDLRGLKLADLIHNAQSIVACDPKFSPVYMAEMRKMINAIEPPHSSEHWSDALDWKARQVVLEWWWRQG